MIVSFYSYRNRIIDVISVVIRDVQDLQRMDVKLEWNEDLFYIYQ